jgi:hypothetical protein
MVLQKITRIPQKIKQFNQLSNSTKKCIFNYTIYLLSQKIPFKQFQDLIGSQFYQEFNKEIELAINESKAVKFIKENILAEIKINNYNEYLILYIHHANVGDTCKVFSLIKALCIQHKAQAIVFYRNKNSPIIQANLFLDSIQPEYVITHFPIDNEMANTIETLSKEDKIPLGLIPISVGIPVRLGTEGQLCVYIKDTSIYKDGFPASLGINITLNEQTILKPVVKNESFEKALNKFKKLNLLEKKSILLAPIANTVDKRIGSNMKLRQFWQKLIEALIANDIIVVINAKNHDKSTNYLRQMFSSDSNKLKFIEDLSLDEVMPFVELCGGFIGIYSGLPLLLGMCSKNNSNTTKIVIKPLQDFTFDQKSYGRQYLDKEIMRTEFYNYSIIVEDCENDIHISKIMEVVQKGYKMADELKNL